MLGALGICDCNWRSRQVAAGAALAAVAVAVAAAAFRAAATAIAAGLLKGPPAETLLEGRDLGFKIQGVQRALPFALVPVKPPSIKTLDDGRYLI